MTIVEVKYSLVSSTCKIAIDAERVSNFSDLASLEGRPFHLCAKKMLKLLDEEIGDDYVIQLSGLSYQIQLLTELAKKSRYCKSVVGIDIETFMSIDDISRFFVSLAQRYNITSSKQDMRVRITGSASESVTAAFPYFQVDGPAELQIEYPENFINPSCKNVAVLSNNYDIQYKGNACIFTIPTDCADAFFKYYYAVCKVQPFTEDVINACRYLSVSEEDKLSLAYVTTQTPQYYFFLEKDTMEIGEQVGFRFRSFPEEAYTLRCDKKDMLTFSDDTVSCKVGGTVKVSVCDRSGNMQTERTLTCIQHTYLSSIRLHASKNILKQNERVMVYALLMPENAEDANSLEWSVSDNTIAHITANGEVIALQPGRFTISVKGKKAYSSMEMRVASEIKSISVTALQHTVEIGGSVDLQCSINPPDAFVKGIAWSLDDEKMGTLSKSEDEYHYIFTATKDHLGTAKITCRPKGIDSDISGSCEITVEPENRPSGFIACTVIFTILGLVFSFLIPVLWSTGAGIAGYFLDICLPISLIMSLIGRSKYSDIKPFKTCLTLNIIFTIIMFLIAMV